MKFNKLRFIDLFAGIGGLRIGWEQACQDYNIQTKCVFSSEIDKDCQNVYESYFHEKPFGDIKEIKTNDIPDHDVLLAGFPCQSFSIMGKMNGFADTRGTLFYEIERILSKKKPEVILLENVKQFKTHDKGRTFKTVKNKLEKLGYYIYAEVKNALNFGLPQKRERTFIVGFLKRYKYKFPNPCLDYNLKDILEPDNIVDESYFASERIIKNRISTITSKPFYPSVWHENKGGNVSILPYSCAIRYGASYNYLLVNGIRRPTKLELLRLQGFPEDFPLNNSYTQVRKQFGNSVAIPVVKAISIEILNSLRNNQYEKKYYQTKLNEIYSEPL